MMQTIGYSGYGISKHARVPQFYMSRKDIAITILIIIAIVAIALSWLLPIPTVYWRQRAENLCNVVDRGALVYFDIRYDKQGTQLVHFKCEDGTQYLWDEDRRNYFIIDHEGAHK